MMFIGAKNRGFTLVELVTIILLLGILSAVALPRFFNATDFTGRGFYDEVAGAARYAQKLAVASGCAVQFSIDDGNDTYVLNQRANGCINGAFTRQVLRPSGGDPFAGSAPNGVNLTATAANVVFDAEGRATPGGVTVTVGGRAFTIVGESGYVDIP